MIKISGGRQTACVVFMICLLTGCGQKKDHVETKMFSLEKILSLDTENNKTAEMGLTDIHHFDIDSEGRIYIANLKSKENYIFVLNTDGGLLSVFGKQGQGPGEFQSPRELVISDQDEIFVTDQGKVVVFSSGGRLMNEFRIGEDYQKIIPLEKDRYMAIAVKLNEDLSQSFQVILCSSGLEEFKILDSSKIDSFKMGAKVNIIPTLVHWEKSKSHIYTGNTDEYKIRVFDFEGNLLETIEKKHDAVVLSEKDKEEYEKRLQNYPPRIRQSFFIPDVFPPFKNIVALGDKWLFIQTYEESNEKSSIYDIFDTNGKFAGKAELEGYRVKFKGGNVYCLKQKENGYKELVVYRMIWGE